MSDSDDEEELRRMRQSKNFVPAYAARPPTHAAAADDEDDDDAAVRPEVDARANDDHDHGDDDDDAVRRAAFRSMGLPSNFGAAAAGDDDEDERASTKASSATAQSSAVSFAERSEQSASASSSASSDLDARVPATHDVALAQAHEKKIVSALAMDRAGSRFVSGSHDYAVKFWNFGGMTSELRSFRSVTPADGYQVTSLDYSFNGALFLVATTSSQAKLYDRDGFEQKTFARGDSYLFDMKKTTGHTTQVNEARFAYGGQPDAAFTVSNDGTLRRWRVATADRSHELCALAKDAKGKKVSLLCLAVGEAFVATGADNGTLLLWSTKGPFSRPHAVVQAHAPGDDAVTRCALSPCGKFLLTRSATDHQLALFDVRNTKQALWRVAGLYASHPTTACGFAPPNSAFAPSDAAPPSGSDALLAYAAVGARPGSSEPGGVTVVECATGRTLGHAPLAPGVGAVAALWHPAINQIVVGQTDGVVRVFYRPGASVAGVVPALGKRAARKQESVVPHAPIHLPNAHEAFAEPISRKRQFEKDRQDARKTRRPDVGSKEALAAMRDPKVVARKLGAGGQQVMERLIESGELSTKRLFRAEDPVEALLKYADSGPAVFTSAYAKTQPVPVFDYSAVEGEDDDADDKKVTKL